MNSSPFDHRPLPEVGEALRDTWGAVDDPAFVERVLAEARVLDVRNPNGDAWDVLTTWARPVVAAAALVVVIVGAAVLLPQSPNPDFTLDDALTASEPNAPSLLMVSPEPPDVDIVLASHFER